MTIQVLEKISAALPQFETLSPHPLQPFWDDMMPDFDLKDPFWGKSRKAYAPTLFISGPGRNGNHLLHSMMDSHPELARIGGEDSVLAAFFKDACQSAAKAKERLLGAGNVDYLLQLSGCGVNKWKLTAEMNRGGAIRKTDVWAGVHDEKQFASDYQDTAVSVNYPAYEKKLREICPRFSSMETFVDVFWSYLDALKLLDDERKPGKFPHVYVGSGMRAEMSFLFSRVENLWCIAPIRPFETFYYSFAKGRKQSNEVEPALIQEAWEHWWHKTVDYLILKKKYPDRVCLINFEHMILSTEQTAREICRFLGVPFSESCLIPTSMGIPTKGNSSFPKGEEARGKFYGESLDRKLDSKYWPELYPALWSMVERLAV